MRTKIVKVSQVARRLGVHPATVRTWCKERRRIEGVIRTLKTVGGHWRLEVLDAEGLSEER